MHKHAVKVKLDRKRVNTSSEDFLGTIPSEAEYIELPNGDVAVTPMAGRRALFRTIFGPGRESEADAAAIGSADTAGRLRHGDLVELGKERPGTYDPSRVYSFVPDMSETYGAPSRSEPSSPRAWSTPVSVYAENPTDDSPEAGYAEGSSITVRRIPGEPNGLPYRLSRIPERVATFLHEMAHTYNPVLLRGGSKGSSAKWADPVARIIRTTLQPSYGMYFSRPYEKQIAAAAQKALFMSQDEDGRDLALMGSDRAAADAWGKMILDMAGDREGPTDIKVYGDFIQDAMAAARDRMPDASKNELRTEADRMYGERHLGGGMRSRNPAFDPHLGSSIIGMFLKLYRARGNSPDAQKAYDRFMNDWGRALRRADNGRRRTGPAYSGTMNA